MFRVSLLGTTKVQTPERLLAGRDFAGVKPRQILEILAVELGRPVSKDRLAELLWQGEPPHSYVGTLEGYVSLLRRALQPGVPAARSVIRTAHGCYQLDAEQVTVDLHVFASAVSQAPSLPAGQGRELVGSLLVTADRVALQSEPHASWAQTARTDHDACRRTARQYLVEQALLAGDGEAAVVQARYLYAEDPLDEAACGLLMQAHAAAGNRTAALRAYQQCRSALGEELGLEPGADLQARFVDLLRDGSLPPPQAAVTSLSDRRERRRSTDQVEVMIDLVLDALDGSLPRRATGRPAVPDEVVRQVRQLVAARVAGQRLGSVAAG